MVGQRRPKIWPWFTTVRRWGTPNFWHSMRKSKNVRPVRRAILGVEITVAKSKKPDPREVKNDAATALRKGKHKDALEHYATLQTLEPKEATWPQKRAEIYAKLGDKDKEIAALMIAAEIYSQGGFLLKGIAVCKRILVLNPAHSETQTKLAALHASQKKETTHSPFTAKLANTIAPTLAKENAAIDEIELSEAVTTSSEAPRVQAPVPKDDFGAIPLEFDSSDSDFELELDTGSSVPFDFGTQSALGAENAPTSKSNQDDAASARSAIPKVPLFSALTEPALTRLINKTVLLELHEDETLFEQGDAGDALYVVVEGAVAAIADGTRFAVLEENDFFGEIALLTDQPRNATIKALVETKLLVVHRAVINSLIQQEPSTLRAVLQFLRNRLIERLIKTNRLFKQLPREERQRLAALFSFLEIPKGSTIIEQGRDADAMYILLSGSADVVRKTDTTNTKLATLQAGDVFGEVSVLTSRSAGANVIATQKCFALALPAESCKKLLAEDARVRLYVQELAQERELQNAATLSEASSYAGARVSVI